MNFSSPYSSSLFLPGLSHLLPQPKIHLCAVDCEPISPTLASFLCLRPVQVSNGHVHQANPGSSNLLHPKVWESPPFNSLHLIHSLIFPKRCAWYHYVHMGPWIYSFPLSHTVHWMVSLINWTSPHSLLLPIASARFRPPSFALWTLCGASSFSSCPSPCSSINTIHPPRVWTCQWSVRILQDLSAWNRENMAHGPNLAHLVSVWIKLMYKLNSSFAWK